MFWFQFEGHIPRKQQTMRFFRRLYFQKVHCGGADEAGHEGGGRLFINLDGGADLFEPSFIHHDEPVGQGHGASEP